MNRWWMAVAVAAVVTLACVPLALAGQGKPDKVHSGAAKGKAKFQCEALVVGAGRASIEATVTSGSKTVKAYRGKRVTMNIDAKAKLSDATTDPSQPLQLEDLAPGAKVHLAGTIDRKSDTPFTVTKLILQKLPKTP
jgi:hypothetical protein